MNFKKVLLNSVWFGIIPKISSLATILLLPVITPFLTPSDYGIWGIISSYVSLFIAIYTLGLHVHLGNSFYEYKVHYPKVWGRLLFLLIISSIFFSGVCILLIFPLFIEYSFLAKLTLALLASFPILFNVNSLIANHFFTLTANPKPLVFRALISSLLGLLVLYISVYFFNLGYLGFILNAGVSSLILFILYIDVLWVKERLFPRVDKNLKRIKIGLIRSFPVIPHALGFILLSSVSRIIMGFHNVPIEEIGLFTNGYIIGDYITVVSSAVVTSIVPLMQTAYRSGNFIKYRQYFYFSQTIALITIGLFSIWMPEIYLIFIKNPDLQSAMPIAQKISFANAVLPFYYFISTAVFIEKRNRELLWLVFLPGVINIMLCLIFIPLFGLNAAIYSTIISYWSLLLVPFISKYHRIQIRLWFGESYKLIFFLLSLIVMFFTSIIMSEFDIFFKLLFTIGFLLSLIQVYIIVRRKYDLFIF